MKRNPSPAPATRSSFASIAGGFVSTAARGATKAGTTAGARLPDQLARR